MTDLNRPLGQDARPKARSSGTGRWALVALALLIVIASAWWMLFGPQPPVTSARVVLGDETEIVDAPAPAADEQTAMVNDGGLTPLSPLEPLEGEADDGSRDFTPLSPTDEADGASGDDAGGRIIRVPEPGRRSGPVRNPSVPIPALIEKSEFGPLPRIGRDGTRPLDAYSGTSAAGSAARIAVVVGGLGLSQTGTLQAIETLPASVTLGFSPLGNSLQRWMTMARRKGHEVVLQLPMEPLGYPTIDPGPRTLTRVAEPGANLANLRWALGRMTNYPLVMNYLGAGLSPERAQLEPLLAELRDRGLAYFDDGTVRASMAPVLSREMRLPFARGSLTIDANRDDTAIRASLKQLEAVAARRGRAAGTATAFPTSVKLIADWAKDAERRGVAIVPLSNLVKDYAR